MLQPFYMSHAGASPSKKPLRLCHLADVHLGYRRYNRLTKTGMNQREVDVNLAFQEAITRIASIKPDVTIIAGDLFHAVRPSNAIVTFCFRQLKRLVRESGAPVVIVGGNHEAPKRADTGSVLQLFTEIEGVYVADAARETFTFADSSLSVTCVPHAALLEGFQQPLRSDDRCDHNVLVVHAQVNENWVSDFGGAEVELKSLAPHEWDYIALGHVHVHRVVGLNAVYAGSLEHTATNIWSEARDLKGFLEVTLPTGKRTFHALTSPREVVLLDPIDAAELDPEGLTQAIHQRVEGVAGGIDGKLVRLEIQGVSRECYRNLDHKELRALRARALNFTLDISFASHATLVKSSRHVGRGGLTEELVEFAKRSEVPGISKDELGQVITSYLTQLEAKHEAT